MSDVQKCCPTGGDRADTSGPPQSPVEVSDGKWNDIATLKMTPIKQDQEKLAPVIETAGHEESPAASASSPSIASSPKTTFILGAPDSRRTSLDSVSAIPCRRQSVSRPASRRRSSQSPSRIMSKTRNHSIIASSISTLSSSSSSHFTHGTSTDGTTSPTCKRSDSACFSDITTLSSTSSSYSGASSTVELSRATSCAHPECVMAPPCERMVRS